MEKKECEMISTTVFSDGVNGVNGGNPAPVFLQADGMTGEEMQGAAAKLGAEAVFVLKSGREDCDFGLRYFVPDHELTICAHDTIGAVTVMLEEGMLSGDSAKIETKAGVFSVAWSKDEKGYLVMLEQFLPEYGTKAPSAADVCRALRIPEDQLSVTENLPLETVSTSRPKLMVPVKNREVLDSLKPDYELLWTLCEACGCSGFYVFAMDPEKPDTCCARQFPLRSGYDEDPATGIAATALGAYAVKHGLLKTEDGWNRLHVYQGHAMGRPSYLAADLQVAEGKITGVRVCGYAERIR